MTLGKASWYANDQTQADTAAEGGTELSLPGKSRVGRGVVCPDLLSFGCHEVGWRASFWVTVLAVPSLSQFALVVPGSSLRCCSIVVRRSKVFLAGRCSVGWFRISACASSTFSGALSISTRVAGGLAICTRGTRVGLAIGASGTRVSLTVSVSGTKIISASSSLAIGRGYNNVCSDEQIA